MPIKFFSVKTTKNLIFRLGIY